MFEIFFVGLLGKVLSFEGEASKDVFVALLEDEFVVD